MNKCLSLRDEQYKHSQTQFVNLHVCAGLWTILGEENIGQEQGCRQAEDKRVGLEWDGETERGSEGLKV